MRYKPSVFAALVCAALVIPIGGRNGAWAEPPEELDGLPLLLYEDFEKGADRWEMTDPQAWNVIEEDGNHVLALQGSSRYAPPVRSPLSIAWLREFKLTDFTLEVKLKQTGKEYGHRDLCLFFGGTDPSHFYYAHLATKADDHANSIFLVNGAPRVSIAKERTKGTDWATGYHTIRIKRRSACGSIEVYFDDMKKPVMVAEDKTFLCGSIGLGSFDDVGQFDDVCLWGKKLQACSAGKPAACTEPKEAECDAKGADSSEQASGSGSK